MACQSFLIVSPNMGDVGRLLQEFKKRKGEAKGMGLLQNIHQHVHSARAQDLSLQRQLQLVWFHLCCLQQLLSLQLRGLCHQQLHLRCLKLWLRKLLHLQFSPLWPCSSRCCKAGREGAGAAEHRAQHGEIGVEGGHRCPPAQT